VATCKISVSVQFDNDKITHHWSQEY